MATAQRGRRTDPRGIRPLGNHLWIEPLGSSYRSQCYCRKPSFSTRAPIHNRWRISPGSKPAVDPLRCNPTLEPGNALFNVASMCRQTESTLFPLSAVVTFDPPLSTWQHVEMRTKTLLAVQVQHMQGGANVQHKRELHATRSPRKFHAHAQGASISLSNFWLASVSAHHGNLTYLGKNRWTEPRSACDDAQTITRVEAHQSVAPFTFPLLACKNGGTAPAMEDRNKDLYTRQALCRLPGPSPGALREGVVPVQQGAATCASSLASARMAYLTNAIPRFIARKSCNFSHP